MERGILKIFSAAADSEFLRHLFIRLIRCRRRSFTVKQWSLQLSGKETVIDAYCGIGTIGLIASKHAKNVISVELNPDAVRDAIVNAKVNGIKNVRFYKADAGRFLTQMAEEGAKADVLLMDPPRNGSSEEFLRSAALLGPGKIVYISCNPVSLGRDLGVLKKLGYRAEECWMVDMFPWVGHVESVIIMQNCGLKGK